MIFALSAIPVIGVIGAAVDFSKANDAKSQIQNALDAAVLAGVTQVSANQVATAGKLFDLNVNGKDLTSTARSFTQNADGSLSGTASTSVSTSFLTVLGMSLLPITTSSTASPGKPPTSVCILLVNQLKSQALLVNSGAVLNAPTCEVHVASTQNPAAMFNATLNVKRICVKGANVTRNGGVTPPVETGCSTISDPFAGKLPAVTIGTCINQSPLSGNVTLNPGTYCGGVNFNGSGTLTLNSGLYILKSGSMILNSGWTVNGTDVTFYFADQNSYIQFNSNVTANLSAPTTGTYANILMFEPTGLSNTQLPINGTSSSSFTGLFYLPSRDVTINSVSNVSSSSVTMVFSTLILNATNWTIAPGALSMSVASGAAASAYLSK